MSSTTTTTETPPLWKQGKNRDLEFANLKLLERTGAECIQANTVDRGFYHTRLNYSYKVGCSKRGLYISRKKLGQNIAIPDMVEVTSQNTEVGDSPLLTESALNELFKQILALKFENMMLIGKQLNK